MWLPLLTTWDNTAFLARKPDLGETAVYRVNRHYESETDKFTLEWMDELTVKVSQRDSLGKFVETMSWKSLGSKLDDQLLPAPDKAKPFVYQQQCDAYGYFVSRDPDPDDTALQCRYARSWTLSLPGADTAVGDQWDTKFTGESDSPGVPCVSRLKLTKVEGGIATLDVHFWEKKPSNPLKAIGSATVDVASGQLREIHLDYQNAPIPGGEGGPVKMHLDWVRKDLIPA